MRRFILALAMLAIFATVAWATYSNKGAKYVSAGTSDATYTMTGRPASAFSIYTESADLTIGITGNTQDDGWPITVKAGTTKTMEGLDIYAIIITRTSSTAYDLMWW